MSKNLTFYLIRHGRTVWNEQGLLQGLGNSDLTESACQRCKINRYCTKKRALCCGLFQLSATHY